MGRIGEIFSEQTRDEILYQNSNEIITECLTAEIKKLRAEIYNLRMINLRQQREILNKL